MAHKSASCILNETSVCTQQIAAPRGNQQGNRVSLLAAHTKFIHAALLAPASLSRDIGSHSAVASVDIAGGHPRCCGGRTLLLSSLSHLSPSLSPPSHPQLSATRAALVLLVLRRGWVKWQPPLVVDGKEGLVSSWAWLAPMHPFAIISPPPFVCRFRSVTNLLFPYGLEMVGLFLYYVRLVISMDMCDLSRTLC